MSESLAARLSRLDTESKGGVESGWPQEAFAPAVAKMTPSMIERLGAMSDAELTELMFEDGQADAELSEALSLVDWSICEFENGTCDLIADATAPDLRRLVELSLELLRSPREEWQVIIERRVDHIDGEVLSTFVDRLYAKEAVQ
jgi:hypothetical protein